MSNKKSKKTSEKNKPVFKAEGMKVSTVRRLSENVVAFSLLGNGLGLYNLKVIDGAKGVFIGTPSSKGSDGKYYAQYAVYFDEKTEKAIIKKVMEILEEDDEDDEDEEDDADDIPF